MYYYSIEMVLSPNWLYTKKKKKNYFYSLFSKNLGLMLSTGRVMLVWLSLERTMFANGFSRPLDGLGPWAKNKWSKTQASHGLGHLSICIQQPHLYLAWAEGLGSTFNPKIKRKRATEPMKRLKCLNCWLGEEFHISFILKEPEKRNSTQKAIESTKWGESALVLKPTHLTCLTTDPSQPSQPTQVRSNLKIAP